MCNCALCTSVLVYLNLHYIPEYSWIYLNSPEFTLIYVYLTWFMWIYMNLHKFSWVYLYLTKHILSSQNFPEFTKTLNKRKAYLHILAIGTYGLNHKHADFLHFIFTHDLIFYTIMDCKEHNIFHVWISTNLPKYTLFYLNLPEFTFVFLNLPETT